MKIFSAFIWLVFATSTVFSQVAEIGTSKSSGPEAPSYAQRLLGKEVYRVMRSHFIFDDTRPVHKVETWPVIESQITLNEYFSYNHESQQCISNQDNYGSRIYNQQLVALENCQFLRKAEDLQPQIKSSVQVLDERGTMFTVESGVFNVGNSTVCGLRFSNGSKYFPKTIWTADPINCPQKKIKSTWVREEYAN